MQSGTNYKLQSEIICKVNNVQNAKWNTICKVTNKTTSKVQS